MHLALLLCQLLLHWEFLPFLPVRYSQPQGPAGPTQTQAQAFDAPAGFWRSSARECFTAANSILQLCSTWTAAGALPLTPFVAYAIYTAAFINLYGASFPWMCSHASNPLQSMVDANAEECQSSKLHAQHIKRLDRAGIQDLQSSVRLMEGWAVTLTCIGDYFKKFKRDFEQASRRSDGGIDARRSDSLRDGGSGTGLLEYTLFERTLRNFGWLETD